MLAHDPGPADRIGREGRGRIVARAGSEIDPSSQPSRAHTVLETALAESPLRFVRPTFPGSSAASVCLVTFGGGLVDGDRIDVELVVEEGATLVVFTQSTTKAFRGRTSQAIRADVRGTLVLLPDPVACFADARYEQRVDVTLHGDGSAIVLDGFTSGRPAFGERWAMESLDMATTIRRGDRVIVRDAVHLDRGEGPLAARLDPFEAMTTVLAVGPRVRPLLPTLLSPPVVRRDLVAAPSALPFADAVLARIAASSPSLALEEARSRLRNLPDIDVVDPFLSRH
ncbi:MAG: urease accessory protein UreD [Deltaproteobacteria bacterium]|nr:urease accessory protein UreD [Deltaproteobacteria bacterium]